MNSASLKKSPEEFMKESMGKFPIDTFDKKKLPRCIPEGVAEISDGIPGENFEGIHGWDEGTFLNESVNEFFKDYLKKLKNEILKETRRGFFGEILEGIIG